MAARVTTRPILAARRALAGVAGILVIGTLLAGCGIAANGGPPATFPAQTFGSGTVGSATLVTRGLVTAALLTEGLQVVDPKVPYRPAEAPLFRVAPRVVVQVPLPNDPDHGFISIYEFRDAPAAATAANEQAAYVGSGIGRIQFPPGTQFVIRELGPTVIFYAWVPSDVSDSRTPLIATALATVGTEVAVPS